MLGLLVLVISLVALWNVRELLIHKDEPHRSRRLVAQGTLLAVGLVLLRMADCSTGLACLILGSGLIMVTNLGTFRRRPARVHGLCLAILLTGGLILLLGGQGEMAHALGRRKNLSGRTEIWAAVIPAVSNPIIGDGFEGFWIGPDVQKVWRSLSIAGWWDSTGLNEAHNGYIETYLNLGWIGVCIISLVLITGYRRAVLAFQRDPRLGALSLAFVVTFAFYNLTEAGFRMMGLSWIFLLWAIVSASCVLNGSLGDVKPAPRGGTLTRMASMPAFQRVRPFTSHSGFRGGTGPQIGGPTKDQHLDMQL